MEPKFWLVFVTAIIPLLVGAIYYNPKVVGNAWMKASGMTEEKVQSGNMLKIFGSVYLLGIMLSFVLAGFVIHQMSIFGAFYGTDFETPGTEMNEIYNNVMAAIGDNQRGWKHGILHGVMAGLFFAWPIIAFISMFERRGWKYTAIHLGYWIVTLALMGGVLCAYF